MHNLGKLFEQAMAKYGGGRFLTYLEDERLVRLTFTEAGGQIQDWAQYLRNRGVKAGDRVAFVTPKSPHQIRAFYACWWVGAIAVPICEGLGDVEMKFVIEDAEPVVILADSSSKAKVIANAGKVPVVLFDEIRYHDPHATMDVAVVPDEAVAALIYTSGSTGMPKGVMLTHRNFYRNAETALGAVNLLYGKEIIMSLLPYWHSFGLVVEVICSVMGNLEVAIPKDKRDFKKNIHIYRPSVILLVPRIADALRAGVLKRIDEAAPRVQALFNMAIHNASRIFTAGPRLDGGLLRMLTHHTFYDPFVFRRIRHAFGGNLRYSISGGAPLDLEHQIFFKYMGVPVYQGYGLTEATPIVSTNFDLIHKLGSCGRVLPWLTPEQGGDYTFQDETGGRGKNLHGELLLRGDCVMKGYWRHADASSKILEDGWLHTGDMGYVDSDGFLFIEGRRNSMIVMAGGEKLHPEHVEDAVKSCDAVSEAMVIGDKCKNVYVCVTLDPEAVEKTPAEKLVPALRKKIVAATAHLAPFQRPKDILVLPCFSVEDGTVTVSLKIRRHKVWEKYGDRITQFLRDNGEEIATKEQIGIASSKVLESLTRNTHGSNGKP